MTTENKAALPAQHDFDQGAMPLPDLVAERVNAEELRKAVRKMVYPYLIGLGIALGMMVIVFFGAMSDKVDRTEYVSTGRQIGDLYSEMTKLRQNVDSLQARSEAIAPDVQQKVIELSNRLRAMESTQITGATESGGRPDALAIAREADKMLEKNAALQLEEVMKQEPALPAPAAEPEKDKKGKKAEEKPAAKPAAAATLSLLQTSMNELRQRLLSSEPLADELGTVITLADKAQIAAPVGLKEQLQGISGGGFVSLAELSASLTNALRDAAAGASAPAIETPEAGRLGSALSEGLSSLVEIKPKKAASNAVLEQIDALEQAMRKNNVRGMREALARLPEPVRTAPSASSLLAQSEEAGRIIEGLDVWRNTVSRALRDSVNQ